MPSWAWVVVIVLITLGVALVRRPWADKPDANSYDSDSPELR